MKVIQLGDPKKVSILLDDQKWIGEQCCCEFCGCIFSLDVSDSDRIHFQVDKISVESRASYGDFYAHVNSGYYINCPDCKMEVMLLRAPNWDNVDKKRVPLSEDPTNFRYKKS